MNLKNGKIYVGVHKTKKLDDGYMGSGKVINAEIKKYGIENFVKVILEQFDTSEAMYAAEKEIVTKEFLSRKDVYNLRRGGTGGFDYINAHRDEIIDPVKQKEWSARGAKTGHRLNGVKQRRGLVPATIKRHKEGKVRYDNFKGMHHTVEAKRKMGEKISIKQSGSNNNQYGTKWVFNGAETKKIPGAEFNSYLAAGWIPGRSKTT